MRFSDDFLTELRARTDIEELVGRYTEIRGRGSRNPTALCPFHTEKTPSFTIYRDTQSYYCFGCGNGGDAITFVKNIEHLDYVEAVRFLCERAGMAMPTDPVDDEYARLRRRCYEATRAAARFFPAQLRTDAAAAARAYLEKRQLKPETVTHFGLGYAPDDWTALTRHLKETGFREDELFAFDLARRSAKTGRAYDTFRNRLIFPVMDLRGNVVAFGARVLDDSKPKYLNTGDTAVYKKGQGIYALNFAKNNAGRKLILCEGYMDVIAMHQAGFTNAVASLGTAFTTEQISLLSRYCDELYLSFDADEAGQKATQRALRMLANAPMKLRVLELTGGKDADEIIKTDGKEKMVQIIQNAKNDTEFALSCAAAKYDLNTDDGKLGFINEAVTVFTDIPNDVEREVYISRVAEMTGTAKAPIETQVKKARRRRGWQEAQRAFEQDAAAAAGESGVSPNPERRKYPRACVAEETILASLIKNPDFLRRFGSKISADSFVTSLNRTFFTDFARRIEENRNIDFSMFAQDAENTQASYLSYLTALSTRIAGSPTEFEECIATLLSEKLKLSAPDPGQMSDEDLKKYFQDKGKER